MLELNTFSIVARCPDTGMLGVAISTAVPAVGALAAFAEAHVGAIATQAWVNPYWGVDGLKALAAGADAETALARLVSADDGREARQIGIVDARGRVAAFTGASCPDWSGHILGEGFAAQGNLLHGAATLDAMAAAFRKGAGAPLAERLVSALESGQAAGGDKRGRQSAALKIVATESYPYLDLRVDAHAEPVAELRRLFELSKHQLLPFLAALPTRAAPLGAPLADDVVSMLMDAPENRRAR